jgi:hypothetical protein
MAITFHIGIVAAFAPATSANTLISIHPSAMPAESSIHAPFSSSIRGRNPSSLFSASSASEASSDRHVS